MVGLLDNEYRANRPIFWNMLYKQCPLRRKAIFPLTFPPIPLYPNNRAHTLSLSTYKYKQIHPRDQGRAPGRSIPQSQYTSRNISKSKAFLALDETHTILLTTLWGGSAMPEQRDIFFLCEDGMLQGLVELG